MKTEKNILRIVAYGEMSAFYIDDNLDCDFHESDGFNALQSIIINLMLKNNIERVEFYYLTEKGYEKFEENGDFLSSFDSYKTENNSTDGQDLLLKNVEEIR